MSSDTYVLILREQIMKGKITISRPSFGDYRQKIVIQIKDDLSKVRFVDVEIDLDIFSKVLTGLSEQECELTVRNLQFVGMKKERIPFSFKMPKHDYSNRKEVANAHAKTLLDDGWVFNGYLGSKDSFTGSGDEIYCNSSIHRYI